MYKRQVVVQRDDGDDQHDDDDEDDDYEDIHGSPLPLRAVYSTIARLALRRSVMRPTKPSQPAREPCAPVPSSTSRAWPSTARIDANAPSYASAGRRRRAENRERVGRRGHCGAAYAGTRGARPRHAYRAVAERPAPEGTIPARTGPNIVARAHHPRAWASAATRLAS